MPPFLPQVVHAVFTVRITRGNLLSDSFFIQTPFHGRVHPMPLIESCVLQLVGKALFPRGLMCLVVISVPDWPS